MFDWRVPYGSIFAGPAVILALALMAVQALAAPAVLGVRTGLQPAATRFVLDLSAAVEFRVFVLPDPYRVVIDLPDVEWRVEPGAAAAQGLIARYRFGHFADGVSRVVLDTTGPVRVERSFLLPPNGASPHRFVLDIAAVSETEFRATAGRPAQVAARPIPLAAPPRRSGGKRVVVIDPGHGGVDPGTTGITGHLEKRITLAVALEVARQLRQTGRYQVVLTRERDTFVRLRQRVARARQAGGELFISLHADSIANRAIRGASVYTISETASDAAAAALAAKENTADLIAGLDLEGESDEVTTILIDLAQRETMNLSAGFANLLVGEIRRTGRILRDGHRFAGFAVLKAPDIPSVLIEMGYLSNRRDERQLGSPDFHKKVAAAIVRGTDRYFSQLND
jgi:N-acetylmuramoyl-L-alanine amidase